MANEGHELAEARHTGLLHADGESDGFCWYTARQVGDGLIYDIPAGALGAGDWLSAHFLVEGKDMVVFKLSVYDDLSAEPFFMTFATLNQCEAKLRFSLASLKLNCWKLPREGALLKPCCYGRAIEPGSVVRVMLTVERKIEDAVVRWGMTPLTLSATEPAVLTDPKLPRGPLLDEFGQYTLTDWPGKTYDLASLVERLKKMHDEAPRQRWPEGFSDWGGWLDKKFEATGFFHRHHDGRRWWLVDPDGYAYWSSASDCVNPGMAGVCDLIAGAVGELPADPEVVYTRSGTNHQMVDYARWNLKRVFGDDWRPAWERITLGLVKRFGFNGFGNWSRWQLASSVSMPYVYPMQGEGLGCAKVFRDFPDVFDPCFEQVAVQFAEQLKPMADDRAMVGYFMMNEPTWGFAEQTPAMGMLLNNDSSHTRSALAESVRSQYGTVEAFQAAWDVPADFDQLAAGRWSYGINARARADLGAFSTVMAKRFFGMLAAACRAAAPNHLNLGVRYYTIPPIWLVDAMTDFDVFGMNCYESRVPAEALAELCERINMPVMIGEWHFGAQDVGLPASGICQVATQEDRAKAFRVYLEDAAGRPWCVGAHWFQWMDQSAIGRFDGEQFNIGMLDVCFQAYEALSHAARTTHGRLYRVANGDLPAYDAAVQYLPRFFC